MGTRNNNHQLFPSDESLDTEEFKKGSKWRQSLRSGLKKTRKLTAGSVKTIQNKAQEKISKITKSKSDEKLDSFERPLPSISSTLETPRDQRLSHDFYDENVNLQSGYYDSSFERNSGSYQPMSHRSGPTSGYGSPIGTRSPVVGSPHGTPRSGRHGSLSENSSGLDADSIFNRVHSQVFPDGTFPDETFPSPPPQLQNQEQSDSRIPKSSSDQTGFGGNGISGSNRFPPPVPARRVKSTSPPKTTFQEEQSTFHPTNRNHYPQPPPQNRHPSTIHSTNHKPRSPPPTRSASTKPRMPPPPPPQIPPGIDPNDSFDQRFPTLNRKQFSTIDMRRDWTLNSDYEHDVDAALEDNDEDDDDFDEEDIVYPPYENDSLHHMSHSHYKAVLRETDQSEATNSQGGNSRPDSFTSLPNETIPHGRSIGSSRGSWAELETSEETLDDNSLDDFDKESRRKSGGPNLTSRLRETFRSTIREAGYGKVRDMVRYVKRPRSAIERHAYKESKRNSQALDPSFVSESVEFDRRSSISSAWAHLPPPPPDATDNDIKRRLIIQSLVKTEKSYISSLETLQSNYRDRLLNMKIIDSNLVEQIFSGVEPILERHQMFGEQLDHVIMEWDTKQAIGEIFCGAFGSQMVLESYSNFINCLPDNLELIRKLCSRKKEFLEFCCQQQNIQGDNLNLYGLMLKPVQRFPQFLLILQDLLSNTAFDHVDRVKIERAVTTLDKLTEQLDQRREIQEQHQLYQKLMKISRDLSDGGDSTTGRVIRSCPCSEITENSSDDEVPIDVREGIIILTDKGKLIFLVGKEGKKARLKTNDANLDGCKIKWSTRITKIAMDDLKNSNPDLIGRIGDRNKIQTELEKISKMESLMESLEISDTNGLREQINIIKDRMSDKLDLIGPQNSMTVSFTSRTSSGWTKIIRFANGNTGRAWIDLIRGQKISLSKKDENIGWKTQEEDDSTTGADRILPIFIGSICTTPEVSIDDDHKRPDTVAFHAYPSPAYDGSILFWNGTDDLIQITHINQEDDESTEPKETQIRINERIFGRNVHQNISSISLTDQVTCLYQLYSAVWCFQANGDVYAFQDVEPFKRLGVTKKLTSDPVVQILTNRENQLIIATKSGGVYLAALSTSGSSFQLEIIKTLIEPTSYPILMIEITVRSEVWCASNGSVSVLRGDIIIDKFDVPEVGKAPLSAGVCIASGVWVARGDLAYLYLYHVHTKTMIQTYDLSKAAFEVQRVHSSFGISSLTTIANLLIAGTTSGIIIALPLPKLPVSTPSIVGPAKAAIHGPTGRVQFISTVQPRYMDRTDTNPEIHLDAAVLFALGTGQRIPKVDEIFANATHVTIWRCCA